VSAREALELVARVEGGRTLLCSPGVGYFSGALAESAFASGGESAGRLATLSRQVRLVVPEGVRGVVLSKPPRRTREPVQYGQVLSELGPLEAAGGRAAAATLAAAAAAHGHDAELAVRSPQSGRFYHRSAPGEPVLCEVGRELDLGTPLGLIEVMKTFTQVVYRAERGLPHRARVVRVVAPDGGDVDEGGTLLVVAPR
jgi:biotin carboxyl carrier protein